MKIINRYVLKEHFGPFVFALSALTSLLLLQYIARKFGDLVGRGLAWSVIAEFMLLSIPFTLALTLPMAMLVSVLHAFSRLASENEITAFKASGISTRALLIPSLVAATVLAFFMVWFNDQVLPRANHELQALQTAILQTKPTFALRPQVINTITESQLYLRAGRIDEGTGVMRDVTIYDVSDGNRRRTIYSDSGLLTMMPNHRDLSLRLYKGWMLSTPTGGGHGQLNRIYYKQSLRRVPDVMKSFQQIDADTVSKGDREMSVCEMQKAFEIASAAVYRAREDSVAILRRAGRAPATRALVPDSSRMPKAGGIGALYCTMVSRYFHVKELHAEVVPRQDTIKDTTKVAKDTTKVAKDTTKALRDTTKAAKDSTKGAKDSANAAASKPPLPVPPAPAGTAVQTPAPPPALTILPQQRGALPPGATPAPTGAALAKALAGTTAPSLGGTGSLKSDLSDAHVRLEDARYRRNRADIEIQKKFSLAFACIVFVLVGGPLALRFPRGGVGLVLGATFLIVAVYYVGLTAGESLADKSIVSPFWAMWAANVIFLAAGLLLVARMGREGVTGRGGSLGELFAGLFKRS